MKSGKNPVFQQLEHGVLLLISMKQNSLVKLLVLSLLLAITAAAGCAPPMRFENERGRFAQVSDSEAAIPTGLRRTKNGWEDTTLWHVAPTYQSRTIHEWVTAQEQREPGWMRKALERIRKTPPWMIAVIQITCIAAIVRMERLSASNKHGAAIGDGFEDSEDQRRYSR